jgi:hypothetical protein
VQARIVQLICLAERDIGLRQLAIMQQTVLLKLFRARRDQPYARKGFKDHT